MKYELSSEIAVFGPTIDGRIQCDLIPTDTYIQNSINFGQSSFAEMNIVSTSLLFLATFLSFVMGTQ